MLALSLLWLLVGLVVGALGLAARLRPASWARHGWLKLLALGAVAGLLGGWLGTFFLGRYFGTPTALWIAVVAVAAAPLVVARLHTRQEADHP
jgi:uncharacterized membrane protein YeaQ/YmgE (transglycosylase-associated protein family)